VMRPVGQRPAALLCLLALVASPFAVPFAGLTAPALAQQRSGRAAPPAREPAAKEPTKDAPADAPAPYDRDLLRMSEIIGALAFLRGLCGSPDAADWPARMKALIESEGVTAARRDYALTYRVCTPAAHEAAARYVAEGDRLSHALAGRFGG
jgi:uncharacterized protein (TIGR02301 family)